jgi:putative membrane protein
VKYLWCSILLVVFAWSVIGARDYTVWFLEVLPVIIATLVLALTWNRFRLTGLLYALILAHFIVLLVGGHYTYAQVPYFDTLAKWLGQGRNSYDKLGHFMQGFVPAIVAREILIRRAVVASAAWRNFFIVSICLAISALYEIFEWTIALLARQSAEAFLGTQGYAWDTQSDMAFALIGAVLALLILGSVHDRQLAGMLQKQSEKV